MRVIYAQENAAIGPDDHVIFLAGPTPLYFGEDRATHSWRDTIIKACSQIDNVIIVSPEPRTKNWTDVDTKTTDRQELVEHQVLWEHEWLEKAHTIAYWCEMRFKKDAGTNERCYYGQSDRANCGPTTRFEIGNYLFDNKKTRLFGIPENAQNVNWLKVHLNHMKHTYSETFEDFVDTITFTLNQNVTIINP